VGDATEGIEDLGRNVRRLIKPREPGAGRLNDWIAFATPDFDSMVQNAVERVFKLLDLPRRSDIEALNENLLRVAEAVESLQAERHRPASPAAGQEPDPGVDREP
jgi:hypothetical protein